MGSTALRLLGFLSFPRGFQLGIRNRSRNWVADQIEIILQNPSLPEKAPEVKKAWVMWKLSQDSVEVYHQDSTIGHPSKAIILFMAL